MELVEDLVERGNELFEAAEMEIDQSLTKSAAKFQEGVAQLLKAYLYLHDQNESGNLEKLFESCKRIEPSLAAVQDEMDLLLDSEIDDGEELIDAANEIWDFVIDLLSEDE